MLPFGKAARPACFSLLLNLVALAEICIQWLQLFLPLARCQAAFLDSPKSNCFAVTGVFQGVPLLFGPERDQECSGLCSIFQRCLFREMPSKWYTIHGFKYSCACSSAAFMHLALLKTKCYLLGWNWIHSTSSNLSENFHFPCKGGMHSNSLHHAFRSIPWKDGAKPIQQILLPSFSNILKYLFTIHFDNFPGSF